MTAAGGITIRRLGEEDRPRVVRLAQLDSAHAPDGDLLGLEVEGRLLAAISLSTGDSIADAFSNSEDLRGLLELRRTQLQQRERRRARRATSAKAHRAARPAGGHPRVPAFLQPGRRERSGTRAGFPLHERGRRAS